MTHQELLDGYRKLITEGLHMNDAAQQTLWTFAMNFGVEATVLALATAIEVIADTEAPESLSRRYRKLSEKIRQAALSALIDTSAIQREQEGALEKTLAELGAVSPLEMSKESDIFKLCVDISAFAIGQLFIEESIEFMLREFDLRLPECWRANLHRSTLSAVAADNEQFSARVQYSVDWDAPNTPQQYVVTVFARKQQEIRSNNV